MSRILTYIYSLSDPRTGEIRYVGKSDNPYNRLNEHIKKCKLSITHKNNWIKSLLNENLKPIVEILDTVSIDEWGFWETYWIDTVRSWGFNLTNIASGGRGGNQGIIVNKLISTKLKNRVFSNKTIEKMSISAKNRKISNEGRKRLSVCRSGSGNPMYGKKRPESSKKYRAIIQLDLNNNIIRVWRGVILASKELKINRCTITDVCNNRKKTAGGFIWKYYE